MSIIERNMLLRGSKGERSLSALFDSGASYSCIRRDLAENLEILTPLIKKLKFETAEVGKEIEATSRVIVDFYMDDIRFSDEFIVIDNLSDDVIIGAVTMQKWRMKLDFEHDKVLFDHKAKKLRIV